MALTGRLTDLLGDTDAEQYDVLLALVATLQTGMIMARGEHMTRNLDSPLLQG